MALLEVADVSRPAVEVRDLVKSFDDLRAVDRLSFALEPGRAMALLGPNGSGKTTILRCIAGLLRPDGGTIRVGGFDLERDYRRARFQFSYVPQHASFPPNVTVREILEFHARLRRLDDASIEKALGVAGLGERDQGRLAGELSGGLRQRLSLAVAALPDVRLMLLDEPTANLDPEATLRLRNLIRQWRNDGRAVLFATHVLTDVEELADRVVVLVGGKAVVQEDVGRLREDLSRFALLRVDVGKPTEAHRQAALESGAIEARFNSHSLIIAAPIDRRYRILSRLGEVGRIHHFETEEPSLERLYIEYVRGDRAASN